MAKLPSTLCIYYALYKATHYKLLVWQFGPLLPSFRLFNRFQWLMGHDQVVPSFLLAAVCFDTHSEHSGLCTIKCIKV